MANNLPERKIEIDLKDEDNLELAWGWWLADENYIKWLQHKDDKKADNQLGLFDLPTKRSRK